MCTPDFETKSLTLEISEIGVARGIGRTQCMKEVGREYSSLGGNFQRLQAERFQTEWPVVWICSNIQRRGGSGMDGLHGVNMDGQVHDA